jgi:peptidoglycan/LPS O-acetylase OafA/YrhL
MQYLIKIILSALVITFVAEIAKRFTFVAAIAASLPLTSILALIWLYHDTKDVQKIIDLSSSIFWAVLPSLLFFIVLPLLLKRGVNFNHAMLISGVAMFVGYTAYALILNKFGIKI